MSGFDPTHNESVINGLFRAIELVEHATKCDLHVRVAIVPNDDPKMQYYGKDEIPEPRYPRRR